MVLLIIEFQIAAEMLAPYGKARLNAMNWYVQHIKEREIPHIVEYASSEIPTGASMPGKRRPKKGSQKETPPKMAYTGRSCSGCCGDPPKMPDFMADSTSTISWNTLGSGQIWV